MWDYFILCLPFQLAHSPSEANSPHITQCHHRPHFSLVWMEQWFQQHAWNLEVPSSSGHFLCVRSPAPSWNGSCCVFFMLPPDFLALLCSSANSPLWFFSIIVLTCAWDLAYCYFQRYLFGQLANTEHSQEKRKLIENFYLGIHSSSLLLFQNSPAASCRHTGST